MTARCMPRPRPAAELAFPVALAGLLVLGATSGGAGCAAEPARVYHVPPRSVGLDIPPGPIVSGAGACALARDESGKAVVAKIHINVGERRIILLPDGQLVTRPKAETPITDQPFVPLTKEAIAERLTHSGLEGFQIRTTRRYLYLYDSSDRFAEATSRILETMFRGLVAFAQSQKIDVHPPEVPLVVIIFRRGDEFRKYRVMPEGATAYYDVVTNRIVLYEQTEMWRIKPELAIQQSIATIAHEGAHQILHNIGVQQRLSVWPMWLNEGLAEFLAPTTTDRQLKWKGVGQINDLRMFELEQYLKNRTGEQASGELVAQTIGAARLTSTGYASAWALVHYLAKLRRAEFDALVRRLTALGPLEALGPTVPPGVIPENVRLFKRYFGEDLADMERRLILYLKHQPYRDPFAEWPHFVAMVTMPAGRGAPRREANVFHTPDAARRWCRELLEHASSAERAAAHSTVQPFPNRAMAEQFARQWLRGG